MFFFIVANSQIDEVTVETIRNTQKLNFKIKKMETSIDWKYFFGGSSGRSFDRYYKAEINGIRVEKHASNKGVKFAIGNIDEAKKKFKTESELLAACMADKTKNTNFTK